MVAFMGDVIFVCLVNLHCRILGVDLTFYKALERFWHPDVKADLAVYGCDFEAQVFLDAVIVFKLAFIAQDTVKTGE
ncbi:hypothetical protein D3C87_1592720 [compost metagenome]